MSGHSKFANIKHKKEKNDAAKGKIFTIIGREIAVAVKEGGGPDPLDPSRIPVAIKTIYTFTLSRLSTEFFLYAKALYQSNFDFLSNMGLTPANFTYTNVSGGLGMVGAMSSDSVGPVQIDKDWSHLLP